MTDSVALAGLMSLRLIPMGLWQRLVLSLRRLKYSVTKGKYLTSFELSPAGRKDELPAAYGSSSLFVLPEEMT